jgi:hypothetical protein
VASSFTWHKCFGTLRPRGSTKKPKSPEEMFAKTGIPDPESDGSHDSDSEFLGSCAGWTPNDRTLRKHVPKDIKQEKHQRDETLGASPAKRAKSDPIEIYDFYLDDGDNIEDFNVGNLDLKVSPLKLMKPEIKTGMKNSKLKDDYKVKGKQEPEEPPKWFQAYAAVVERLEKQLNVTMEKVEELKDTKIKQSNQRKMINQRKRMRLMINVQIY